MRKALFFLFLLSSCLYANQTVTTGPGVMVVLDSKTANARWVNVHDDVQLKSSKEGWACFVCRKPGKYKLAWYSLEAKNSEPNYITVEVKEGDLPKPVDKLEQALKEAYSKDTDLKQEKLIVVQAVYAAWAETDLSGVATWGKLLDAVKLSFAKAGLKAGEIPNLRKAIGAHLNSVLETTNADKVLDADAQKLAKTTFLGMAQALQSLKAPQSKGGQK